MTLPLLLLVLGSYLLGSIPNGLLIGKALGVDLRLHGSNNIGATNAFRVLGKPWGILTFLLDAGKGLVPVLAAKMLYASTPGWSATAGIMAGVAAICGHNFPVWLGFKGGKGVATSLGVVIGLVPWAALIAFAVWTVVLYATRYVSIASMVGALTVPITVAILTPRESRTPLLIFSIIAAVLIILRHRINMQRLMNGTEAKIGSKKKA